MENLKEYYALAKSEIWVMEYEFRRDVTLQIVK